MSKRHSEGLDELKYGQVTFKTTAATQDVDYMMLFAYEKPIRIIEAHIMFTDLDTYNSGVDIDIEIDDGSTETEVANYDTVGGGSATAEGTLYEFEFTDEAVIDKDEWFQLRVNDDEDAACGGVVTFAYVELEAMPD